MNHRVCVGSIERFIGMITEHFAGKFPAWLAPVQVKVLPVSEKTLDYAKGIYEQLMAAGIRCQLDERNEKIGYKIREAQAVDRVPYMLILGAKEAENGTVSVRNRDTLETTEMNSAEFITSLCEDIKNRK
jgi:threonyl-tRNA synthetase